MKCEECGSEKVVRKVVDFPDLPFTYALFGLEECTYKCTNCGWYSGICLERKEAE